MRESGGQRATRIVTLARLEQDEQGGSALRAETQYTEAETAACLE